MELEKENQSLNLMRKTRRFFAQLMNLKERVSSRDFRNFIALEYQKTKPEDIIDIKRLKYLRNLDLAKTGYVNTTVSDLISYYKKKRELLESNQEIIPTGHIKIKEHGILKSILKFGYNEKNKGYTVAFHNHDNIPIWKSLDLPQVLEILSHIHPKDGNSLEFEHSFFLRDIKKYFPKIRQEEIGKEYNIIIAKSFASNKYFENGIVKLNLDILNNPSNYLGLPILFPSPQNGHNILKITETNNRFLVFESFLKTAPKPAMVYFTHEDIKEIYNNTQIEPIAKLKFNLLLGIDDGRLFIGAKGNKTKQSINWKTLDEYINTSNNSSKIKYYLSKEIISKKNFVIEEGAIYLENGNKRAYLKRHFKNREWYYGEIGKENTEPNFRPVWDSLKEDIQREFPNSKNLLQALKTINKPEMDNSIKI